MNKNLSQNDLKKIKQKRIIFFGSTYFSKQILKFLISNSYNVILCVSKQDYKKRNKFIYSDLKKFALENKIKIYQPLKLKTSYFKNLKPDFFIICAYGKILKNELLNLVESCINIHPSLLPKYQGAAPIQWALLNNESISGVSLIKTNKYIDQGEIYVQNKISILQEDDYFSFETKLIILSIAMLKKYLNLILLNKITLKKQDLSQKSYALKITRNEEKIDFNNNTLSIYNQIRALCYIGCFAILNSVIIKFQKAKICKNINHLNLKAKNGQIINFDSNGIHVKTQDGCLIILILKISGKKYHSSLNYYKSHPKIINIGDYFE